MRIVGDCLMSVKDLENLKYLFDRLAISDNTSLTQWSIVFCFCKATEDMEMANIEEEWPEHWVVNLEFFLVRILKRTGSCRHGTLPSQLPELLYLAVHVMQKDNNNMRSFASLIDQITPLVLRFCQIKLKVLIFSFLMCEFADWVVKYLPKCDQVWQKFPCNDDWASQEWRAGVLGFVARNAPKRGRTRRV